MEKQDLTLKNLITKMKGINNVIMTILTQWKGFTSEPKGVGSVSY